ncbi:MAG: ABC transporter substrate-binding protein [Bacillota bacterium]|nr:ABC transporter substrate-binding protein [Bacillota bacterium]
MLRRARLMGLFLVAAALLAASCGGQSGPKPSSSSSNPPSSSSSSASGSSNSSSASGGTVTLGVITSITGSQAAFGQAHQRGYEIALEEINAKGGVLGKKIVLDYCDDTSKPDQAVQCVSKLVDQDHVPLVLGSYSSESTYAIVSVMTQKQVPLIIPTATADNVMQSGSPWIFRICAGSGDYARTMVDFLKHNGDPKTMAIIYENTNFGQSNDKSMRQAAAAAGIQVIDEEAYNAGSPDYKAMLQKVKAKHPDAIYFASYLLDAVTLMHQARQVDLNAKYFTAAGTGFSAAEFPTPDKGAGKDAEYTFSVNQWLPDASWPGSKEFDQKFFQKYGSHPAYHAMEAYAALYAAVAGIEKAGSLDPAKIQEALHQIDIQTAFGPVHFGASGQNPHPVLISQVQKGQYMTVWPADAASAKPIYPTPPWSQR